MREYRFNLFGVGGVLRLGRRGPILKANDNAIEVRTPDDSALSRVQAADPDSDDDLVTKRHLQAATTAKLPLPSTGQRLIASHGTAGEIQESPLIVDEQGNLTVPGDLYVEGDSVVVNTGTVEVEDKNMVLARNATTDTMADGGGITLKGATDKILAWMQARAAWFSSENIDLAAGRELRVDGTEYLAAHSTTHLPEGTNLYFTDQRARDANNDHRTNSDIHITPSERTAWNDKADQTSFTNHITNVEAHFAPGEKTVWQAQINAIDPGAITGMQNDITALQTNVSDLQTAVSAIQPLGVGQTWQDVTASRAVNVTYTNTTGRTIAVSIRGIGNNVDVQYFQVDGISVSHGPSFPVSTQLFAVVPPGSTYRYIYSGFAAWLELR